MPYRRLPNTDAARLRAMKKAYKMGREVHPNDLAYGQSTYTRLGLFITSFEQAVLHYRQAYKQQSEKSGEYQAVSRKARLYVSHFLQVVNLAILRDELKPSVRLFFGIEEDETRLPSLTSDQDLLDWGQKIIDGEFERKSRGHAAILNPTIALVKVHYDRFKEACINQRTFQQSTQRTLTKLNELRGTADEIIISIWDEVEQTYAQLPDGARRNKAREYGVHYVYRKNEPRDDEDGTGLLSPETALLFKQFSQEQEENKRPTVNESYLPEKGVGV